MCECMCVCMQHIINLPQLISVNAILHPHAIKLGNKLTTLHAERMRSDIYMCEHAHIVYAVNVCDIKQ